MELTNVEPAEITFQTELADNENGKVFLVDVRNRRYVMKIHHGQVPRQYYDSDREFDPHVLESTAYRRLKEEGVCDTGIVPQFYGTMRKFDPKPFLPHLRKFTEDEYRPSAIFMEYIPNLEKIHLHNYTETRMNNLIKGMSMIHKARVLHEDIKARNMQIIKNDPERVVWLDFDRSRTFDKDKITDKQKEYFAEEAAIVTQFKMGMETDLPKGKLDLAYFFYCS